MLFEVFKKRHEEEEQLARAGLCVEHQDPTITAPSPRIRPRRRIRSYTNVQSERPRGYRRCARRCVAMVRRHERDVATTGLSGSSLDDGFTLSFAKTLSSEGSMGCRWLLVFPTKAKGRPRVLASDESHQPVPSDAPRNPLVLNPTDDDDPRTVPYSSCPPSWFPCVRGGGGRMALRDGRVVQCNKRRPVCRYASRGSVRASGSSVALSNVHGLTGSIDVVNTTGLVRERMGGSVAIPIVCSSPTRHAPWDHQVGSRR
jgi:hypothetical protein